MEPTPEMIQAFLGVRLTKPEDAGGFVFDVIDGCYDDDPLRVSMGLDPMAGEPRQLHGAMADEFRYEVVRRGLQAALAAIKK